MIYHRRDVLICPSSYSCMQHGGSRGKTGMAEVRNALHISKGDLEAIPAIISRIYHSPLLNFSRMVAYSIASSRSDPFGISMSSA
jgi:hypothetical protein